MNTNSWRQQADAQRRRAILAAAADVFAEHGYHRATIRQIAAAAGVADGTVYNVFENKMALLLAMLDPLGELDAPAASVPDDFEGWFRELLRARWTSFTSEQFKLLRIVLSEMLVDSTFRKLYLERVLAPTLSLPLPVLQQGMEQGRLRRMDPELLMRAISATVIGLIVMRLSDEADTRERWDELPDLVADLWWNGLRP